MRPQTRSSSDNITSENKYYSCFVCDVKSPEKGLSLLRSQTAFSRISLGEKLQEILGTRYLVLTSIKDKICWDCASYINWVDRCEHKIDLMKEYFVEKISAKYKKVEIKLTEPADEQLMPPPPPVDNAPKAQEPPPIKVEDRIIYASQQVKQQKKQFICKYCGKEYVTPMTLTLHLQRMHPKKEECKECGAKLESRAKLKRHMKYYHSAPEKQLSCVSCGFQTTNTEIYCRHFCNSSIVSLTCISCNKRYVDSNYREDSGSYQCQACKNELGVVQPAQQESSGSPAPPAETTPLLSPPSPPLSVDEDEITSGELTNEMKELFNDAESNEEDSSDKAYGDVATSYLRCESCGEQFVLSELTNHPCFIRGESVAFCEVEPPTVKKKPQGPPILRCKTCGLQFQNIESLRSHWDHTGHTREVSTPQTELNLIRDKFKKMETTVKVVRQNFEIRATIPGQNDEALRVGDDYKDMFIRVSDRKVDPIEDFVRRDGNTCTTCGSSFSSADLLTEHQKNDCLTCVTCNVSFYDNKLLKKHYLFTGHASKLRLPENLKSKKSQPKQKINSSNPFGYNCHRCTKTFSSRFLLKKHFQVHFKGTDRGACQFCSAEFENKNDIQQHVLEVHGAHLYKCSHCERTFMTEAYRNKHEMKHKLPLQCDICNVKLYSQKALMNHNETYHRGNSCRLCEKIIEDPIALRRHERRHYFERGLECGLCKKKFRNKTLLAAHSRIHSADEIVYQCEICLLGFKTEESLQEHQMCHQAPKRYKCNRCNATYTSRAQFWTHTKSHEKSYRCSVCKRGFRDTSLLAIHRRKHWRVRPYQCPQCSRSFSVAATLRRHINVHTRMYPHRCGICRKGFLTRHAYHRHTETVHAVSNSYQPRRPSIPSLPLNATDEDIFHAADTLIADDSIMFSDYPTKAVEQPSTTDMITNEVIVETTELFDEILS